MSANVHVHESAKRRGVISFALIAITAFILLPLSPHQVIACGWWGDGEMNRDSEPALPTVTDASGQELQGVAASKLPGRLGYGIAVLEPGRAVPYLQATYGWRINRIGDLRSVGYETVIDLGTPANAARLHRKESETVGMRYFNIPITEEFPSRDQVDRFGRLIMGFGRDPVLVYAPAASLLGIMWASYRIDYLGTPISFALDEGRSLGMTEAQGASLIGRLGKQSR